MIEILEESQGNVLAIRGHGKLTPADYSTRLILSLEEIMKEHRRARLFFDMSDTFRGWQIGAAWSYAKYGFKNRERFEKVAAVCGPKWVQWGMKFKSFFVIGEIRTFSCGEQAQALDWITH